MEFTFKVTEAEYQRAWKIRRKTLSRWSLRMGLFWVFILICLFMLWAVVQRDATQPSTPQHAAVQPAVSQSAGNQSSASDWFNIGFFVVVAGVWFYRVFGRNHLRLRRLYRKDPAMQGQFTVNIEPSSLTIRNTAGTLYQAGWNIFENWQERKDLILLIARSGTYFILSLGVLSDFQRNELRSILAAALPKK